MIELRPVLFILGVFMSILSIGMAVPMLADIYAQSPDWKVFFLCSIITAFFGGALILSNNSREFSMNIRQAFLMTFLTWAVVSLFGSLPFYLSKMQMSFTDSLFESVSGITTTGSTVMTGLEDTPHGLLLWRSILQWLGGIGIIIMAMSVLPFLKVGGMQIFQTEMSEDDKAMPRAAMLAKSIGQIYLLLTMVCMGFYMMVGMDAFDAINHAMTTIATGGFSTHDSSFFYYNSFGPEAVAVCFMILSGIPFVLYLKAANGNLRPLLRDSQTQTFLGIIMIAVFVLTLYNVAHLDMELLEAIRRVLFNVVSVITGTGYASADYSAWGAFPFALFAFLMVVGGCAGSTSCGIKVFRFQILYAVAKTQIRKLLHPHSVYIAHYNGKPIPDDVPLSVMSFFFVYAAAFAMLALALSFVGLNFNDALSGAITSISNVGPALGPEIGPAGTFQNLPDSAKWILSVGMLLGRLELFTVLVMLTPRFWLR